MKFQLPTDPKQKQQTLIAIALGAVGLVVVIIMYGIMPVVRTKGELRTKVVELKEQIAKGEKDVALAKKDHEKNYEILNDVWRTAQGSFLIPVLGNPVLPAKNSLISLLGKAGVTDETAYSIVDRNYTDYANLLGKAGQSRITKAYGAEINLRCSYDKLREVVRLIEDSNPCLTVTQIQVTGRAGMGDNNNHNVMIAVQWPAWRDDELPSTIEKLLVEEEKYIKPQAETSENK